jgi:AcrR family transcriptional regulator
MAGREQVPQTIESSSARKIAMRYGKDQKQATRQRILEAAGRRFKEDGIDGAGVATLMSDAGLTNGAFYAHFTSKEDLVANVLADQLRAQHHNRRPRPGSGGTRSVHPLLSVPRAPRPARRRLPIGRAARRDRPPPRRHQTGLHRRAAQHRGRHRGAPRPDRRRGGSNRRAHALRTDARHPAARPRADRPRPVRSASRPRRRDGLEAARRPGMTRRNTRPARPWIQA